MDVSIHEYVIIMLFTCKGKLEYCSALNVGSKNFTNKTTKSERTCGGMGGGDVSVFLSIITMVLSLSALAIVRLFCFFICFRLY